MNTDRKSGSYQPVDDDEASGIGATETVNFVAQTKTEKEAQKFADAIQRLDADELKNRKKR